MRTMSQDRKLTVDALIHECGGLRRIQVRREDRE
jgi:hypothetical protein